MVRVQFLLLDIVLYIVHDESFTKICLNYFNLLKDLQFSLARLSTLGKGLQLFNNDNHTITCICALIQVKNIVVMQLTKSLW